MRTADLQAPIVDPTEGEPLTAWRWLVDSDSVPFLVTALGDVFVRNSRGEIWLLDTYRGRYNRVAPDETTWRTALEESSRVDEWFLPDLLAALREGGLRPAEGECFSPVLPPITGGDMDPANFECSPWLLHISLAGQLHQQSKEHPDGISIAAFVDDDAAQNESSVFAASARK
jgi:hypothetical protein